MIYRYQTEQEMNLIPIKLHNFKEGDTAFIEEEKKAFTFKNGEWVREKGKTFTVPLQDLQTQIFKAFPEIDINKLHKTINDFYFLNSSLHSTFLLINYEEHYCTIFKYGDSPLKETFSEAVIGCLSYLGKIKNINNNGNYMDFWVESDSHSAEYLLIPYEAGVIYYE